MATNERYVQSSADIKFKRSRMPLSKRALLTYFHGYLQPLGVPIEVLPGDTFKLDLSMFVRMSTPIVPFADNIRAECDFFFVPKRILWNRTKAFYGESESFGIQNTVSTEPIINANGTNYMMVMPSDLTTNELKSESIAAAFGLVADVSLSANGPAINVLPIRALLACYNEYYRDENYQNQYKWDKDQYGVISQLATLGTSVINGLSLLPKVNKDRDVFTAILPYQVKGNPIYLSIGTSAPVITTSTLQSWTGTRPSINFSKQDGQDPGTTGHNLNLVASGDGYSGFNQDLGSGSYTGLTPRNLYADLSAASGVNLADLIYSLCYQDFLARCAKYGTRYKEYIYAMFGTVIADASEDIPEYLGRMRFAINVQQVVQTTGFVASTSTELGALGAYSKSGDSKHVFTKSFTEPGYVVPVFYTKHQRTYSSGIDPVFQKHKLLDYYQTPFANIQDVPVKYQNIFVDRGGGTANDSSMGFQEPWFEYRAFQDRVFGMMNPRVDTLGEIWTLADKYSARPTINGTFMIEDRAAIARVLATGVNGPDYIVDSVISIDATRVMPLYPSSKLGIF